MNSKNISWGLFWVVVGALLILRNFDLLCFEINWDLILRFWPVLLIFAGINSLIRGTSNNRFHWLMPVLMILLIVLLCVKGLSWNSSMEQRETNDFSATQSSTAPTFTVENSNNTQFASLYFSGGAAQFVLTDTTSLLFAANMPMNGSGYVMEQVQNDSIENISLKMDGDAKIDLDNKKWNANKVDLLLNANPIWDLDFDLGAGEVNFDLSKYKVRELAIDAGAASLDIKLSDLQNAKVVVNAGASSIILRIPKSINCELNIDAVLSAKSLNGFEKVDENYYVYKSTLPNAKKIDLTIDAGISSVEIIQY
ncbi:MAG: hypothetical protein RIR80_832 [Bacteroidota bacterium]|jgi:hypothetical protein